MQRISIIGCCGAGKSTVARELHRLMQLPVVHLDREFWNAGWVPSDSVEFEQRLRTRCEEEKWIMDGNYFSTMEHRLQRADTVIHLDYSTALCLRRVLKRVMFGLGKVRPDSAKGCPEKLDWKFLCYVATFRRNFRAHTIELLGRYDHLEVHTFTKPRELEVFLEACQHSKNWSR